MAFTKNNIPWNKNKKGVMPTPWNKGIKVIGMHGEKHFAWKGDKASYEAIHTWVKNHKGNPVKCEVCSKEGCRLESSKNKRWNLQWANKSGKYLRDLDDWVGLCVPCHSKFDGITGGHISKAHKLKISKGMKGKNTWMKGRKLSPGTRLKMSEGQKRRYTIK